MKVEDMRRFFDKIFFRIFLIVFAIGTLDAFLVLSGYFASDIPGEKFGTDPLIFEHLFFLLFSPGIFFQVFICDFSFSCFFGISSVFNYFLNGFFLFLSLFFWAFLLRAIFFLGVRVAALFSQKISPLLKR